MVLASIFLGKLLGIEDCKTSITLGNTSKSLPFDTKINLLLDIKALSKEDKSKCEKFMSIRNQFMHNLDAKTCEDLFSILDPGTETYLRKKYSHKENLFTRELSLQLLVKSLSVDVSEIIIKINDIVHDNKNNDYLRWAKEQAYDAIIETFNNESEDFKILLNSEIEKGVIFSLDRLNQIIEKYKSDVRSRYSLVFKERIDKPRSQS